MKSGEWEGRGEGIGDAEGVWWQGRRVAAKRAERQKEGKGEVTGILHQTI